MIENAYKEKKDFYYLASTPNTSGVNKEKFKNFCKKYEKTEIELARKNLSMASRNLLISNPFFGYLLLKQKVVEASAWLPTAAVDGKNLYFNTGFILSLSIPEIQFLVCHELLHLIYGHLGRLSYPNGLPRIPKLFNIANDYIVNADAKHSLSSTEAAIPSSAFINSCYHNFTSEEVYEDLLEKVLKKMKEKDESDKNNEKESDDSNNSSEQNGSSSGGSSGESDSSGSSEQGGGESREQESDENKEKSKEDKMDEVIDEMYPNGTFDDHLDLSGNADNTDEKTTEDENGDMSSHSAPELTEKDITKRMNDLKGDLLVAKDMIGSKKLAGYIPEGVLRVINELQEPVFNWRQYIKKYILGIKKVQTSWTTPKRRSFDSAFILPGKRREKKYSIHVAMDTSGSITEDEIRDFLSEVFGAGRQVGNIEITIWTFDTKVYNVQKYNKQTLQKMKNYQVIGNGGTAFLANWEYMKTNKIVPDLFIMFTDGMYGDAPGIKGYCPTLYVLHGGFEDRVNIDKSYGKCITYKKDAKTKRTN